ncbi:MAG: M42 family metallopeptidase [Firmicutes bacterium]|nr:M42 family metallopeptidase [Bacillota bacterium]
METARSYTPYVLEKLQQLLSIDSTTGDYTEIQAWLEAEFQAMGYPTASLNKGGLLVELGGEGDHILVNAHVDDIGLMVRYINSDGTLEVTPVGGLKAPSAQGENVRIKTRFGKVYTGTVRRTYASLHTTPLAEREVLADFEKNIVVTLDEDVSKAEDVQALGICCGDIVSLEPRFVVTESGYIKSRFLDDKACAAVLMAYAKYLKDNNITPARKITLLFSMYEEIGHGGTAFPGNDYVEYLSLDIGCVGPRQYSSEKKVTIGVKDSRYPYHMGTVDALAKAAEAAGVDYVLDMFLPTYGSDGDGALAAGHDVRHSLVGPGVLETHGYERTHILGLENNLALLLAYLK